MCPLETISDLEEAGRFERRAIALAPHNPDFKSNLALIEALRGRPEQAIKSGRGSGEPAVIEG